MRGEILSRIRTCIRCNVVLKKCGASRPQLPFRRCPSNRPSFIYINVRRCFYFALVAPQASYFIFRPSSIFENGYKRNDSGISRVKICAINAPRVFSQLSYPGHRRIFPSRIIPRSFVPFERVRGVLGFSSGEKTIPWYFSSDTLRHLSRADNEIYEMTLPFSVAPFFELYLSPCTWRSVIFLFFSFFANDPLLNCKGINFD